MDMPANRRTGPIKTVDERELQQMQGDRRLTTIACVENIDGPGCPALLACTLSMVRFTICVKSTLNASLRRSASAPQSQISYMSRNISDLRLAAVATAGTSSPYTETG